MDQNTAKRLCDEGAFFVLLNVPEGTEFGIDMKSWNTGEKFRGIKMIPPGIHFVFYSAVNSVGDAAPRVGFFHDFKQSEFLVRKWDELAEDISDEQVTEREIVSLRGSIKSLDSFLGPYPFDVSERWTGLTKNITASLIEKLSPASGKVRSALELMSCSDADRPRGGINKAEEASGSTVISPSKNPKKPRLSDNFENDLLPDLKPVEGTALRLTEFPDKNFPEGATPAEITRHSLDSTFVLDTIVSKHANLTDIIGELEFSFVCFLVGHSLEAFEHWKKLVSVLCSCESGIKKYRRLYDLFITLIEIHISEIPEEFLADIVSNNNFIYVKLRHLFGAILSSNVDGRLQSKVERFMKNLVEKYMWDFGDLEADEDDEAPVVVEL